MNESDTQNQQAVRTVDASRQRSTHLLWTVGHCV